MPSCGRSPSTWPWPSTSPRSSTATWLASATSGRMRSPGWRSRALKQLCLGLFGRACGARFQRGAQRGGRRHSVSMVARKREKGVDISVWGCLETSAGVVSSSWFKPDCFSPPLLRPSGGMPRDQKLNPVFKGVPWPLRGRDLATVVAASAPSSNQHRALESRSGPLRGLRWRVGGPRL